MRSYVGCVKTSKNSWSGGSMAGGTGLFWLSRLMGQTKNKETHWFRLN
jgi:hypothetical protein